MTVLVVGSLHGSPGATTVAVALAGCLRGAVVVEADCDGGVLAARFGLAREPGLVTLAADRNGRGDDALVRHTQPTPGGVPIVVGPESSEHATWLWRSVGSVLVESLRQHEGLVVVDAGRLAPTAPSTEALAGATMSVIVVRPRADELAIVAARLAGQGNGPRPSLVLVGDRPYSAMEVATELGCDVLGVVADDPRAVSTLWGGGSRRLLARSPFARSMRSLADTVVDRLEGRVARSPRPAEAVKP